MKSYPIYCLSLLMGALALVSISTKAAQQEDRELNLALALSVLESEAKHQQESKTDAALQRTLAESKKEAEKKERHRKEKEERELKQTLALSDKDARLAQKFVEACDRGDKQTVINCIQQGVTLNTMATLEGHEATALIAAAGKNRLEIARMLLDLGADTNVKTSCCSATALHEAISEKDNNAMVELLISRKANVNTAHGGETPLMYAIDDKAFKCFGALLKAGANYDKQTLRHINDMESDILKAQFMSLIDESSRANQAKRSVANQNAQQDTECAICLDKASNPLTLNCDHVFCKKCVANLIATERNAACPLCRKLLTSSDQAKAQQ